MDRYVPSPHPQLRETTRVQKLAAHPPTPPHPIEEAAPYSTPYDTYPHPPTLQPRSQGREIILRVARTERSNQGARVRLFFESDG